MCWPEHSRAGMLSRREGSATGGTELRDACGGRRRRGGRSAGRAVSGGVAGGGAATAAVAAVMATVVLAAEAEAAALQLATRRPATRWPATQTTVAEASTTCRSRIASITASDCPRRCTGHDVADGHREPRTETPSQNPASRSPMRPVRAPQWYQCIPVHSVASLFGEKFSHTWWCRRH